MRCPHCGYAVAEANRSCPACKQPLGAVAPDNPWEAPRAPTAAPAPNPAPDLGPSSIPWETGYSPETLFETVQKVLLETSATFAGAPKRMRINAAFLYALVMGLGFGYLGALVQAALLPSDAQMPSLLGGALAGFSQPSLLTIITVPLETIVGVFLGAGLTHLCLMMIGGANHGFEATFRVVAFTSASVAPLQLIPVLGPFVGGIWALVMEVLGLQQLHDTTGGKAAFAVLAPLSLVCVCVGVGAVAGAAAFSELPNQ